MGYVLYRALVETKWFTDNTDKSDYQPAVHRANKVAVNFVT